MLIARANKPGKNILILMELYYLTVFNGFMAVVSRCQEMSGGVKAEPCKYQIRDSHGIP